MVLLYGILHGRVAHKEIRFIILGLVVAGKISGAITTTRVAILVIHYTLHNAHIMYMSCVARFVLKFVVFILNFKIGIYFTIIFTIIFTEVNLNILRLY